MKFNSQICTTREQSERLLSLGLKKETADMVWTHAYYGTWVVTASESPLYEEGESIPAWSLHRLCDMMPKNIAIDGDTAYPLQIQKRSDGKWCVGYQGWYDCVGDLYDSVICIYQLLISEGYLDEFCNKG
jgi:hypothetical protein